MLEILLILALASARLTVLIVHDTITAPARERVYRRFPPKDVPSLGFEYQRQDKHGNVLPMGAFRKWSYVGELLSCARCTSVWLTAALFAVAWQAGLVEGGHASLGLQFGAVAWGAAWGADRI